MFIGIGRVVWLTLDWRKPSKLNEIMVKIACSSTRRATNPTCYASYMRRASVFLTLWRQAQCAAPLKFAYFHFKLLPFSNTIFLCSIFLLWMQMSPLNMKNDLYTRDFYFFIDKTQFYNVYNWHFLFKLYFRQFASFCLWLNEWLSFCLLCKGWICWSLTRWPGLPLEFLT